MKFIVEPVALSGVRVVTCAAISCSSNGSCPSNANDNPYTGH